MFEDVFNTYPELSGEFKREEIADGIIQRYTLNGKPFAVGVSLKDEDKIKRISGSVSYTQHRAHETGA